MNNKKFTRDSILINPEKEVNKIIEEMKNTILKNMKKRGAVVGVSGGVDSAVVLALAVRALGNSHVLAVMMPERESNSISLELAKKLAKQFEVNYVIEDLSKALEGFGCYFRRDEAVRRIFPEYNNNYGMKISLPAEDPYKDILNVFYLTIITPSGQEIKKRLTVKEYLEIVAASNFKQRSRMAMLYYHAERLNYAVIGTGNKNEHELGFFVKFGDGGADLKPIVHLFKTQVYQLANYLGIPSAITSRPPTTDTYPALHSQEEFFYRLPFDILDRIWYGWEMGVDSKKLAKQLGLSQVQVKYVINDIIRKKRATENLRSV